METPKNGKQVNHVLNSQENEGKKKLKRFDSKKTKAKNCVCVCQIL